MMERTGAQALVGALIAHGARYLFGIPGVHTLPLYDALAGQTDLVPVVPRHEAGATFSADAYARVTGQPGVVSLVPGPGAMNAATGVLCAWSDRVPLVLLSAELDPSDCQAAVHEGDLQAAFRPFTRAQMRIESFDEIEVVIAAAFATAIRPPAGPVQVLVQLHVLKQRGKPAGAGPAQRSVPGREHSAAAEVAAFLSECQSPTLMFGMEVTRAHAEVLRLVERLGAPAFTDAGARGLIPEDHPLAAGLLSWKGAPPVLAAADGMVVLGSRLSEISTLNWDVALPRNLARVDADRTQLQGNYAATLALEADPIAVLRELATLLPPGTTGPNAAALRLAQVRAESDSPVPEPAAGSIHPRAAVRALRAALPRDTIVVTDATATEFWLSEESFPVLSPQGLLLPEVQQTMGYALAGAAGAAIAAPRRPVVCVSGDGSLQMMLGELATAASLDRQLTLVVFEDGYYNALRIYQDGLYGRQMGVKLRNPDFVQVAQAYGARAERVNDVADVGAAIERSLQTPNLSLVSLVIDPGPVPDRYARRLEQMAPVG